MGDRRLLLVEDDPATARALARWLQPFGTIHVAESVAAGLGAVASADAGFFDAAIIDLGLGDGSGFMVLESIRARSPTLPVLVLTGHSDGYSINRALDLDASYAVKPAEADRITMFLLRALARGGDASECLKTTVELWGARYRLTQTETAILARAADGTTLDEIAKERDITPSTLKKHSENLRAKTGDESLLIAVQRLLREALGIRGARPAALAT